MVAANPQQQTFPRERGKKCYSCGCFGILPVALGLCFAAIFSDSGDVAGIPRDAVEVLDSGSRGFFQSYEAFWLLKVKDEAAVKKTVARIATDPLVNEDSEEFQAEANDFSEKTVGRVFDGKTEHFGLNTTGWLWASCIVSEDGNYIYVHAVH